MDSPIRSHMKVGLIHFMAYPSTIDGEGPILETLKKVLVDDYFDAGFASMEIDEQTLRALALAGVVYEYRRAKKRAAAPADGGRRNLNWKFNGRRLSLRSFQTRG